LPTWHIDDSPGGDVDVGGVYGEAVDVAGVHVDGHVLAVGLGQGWGKDRHADLRRLLLAIDGGRPEEICRDVSDKIYEGKR